MQLHRDREKFDASGARLVVIGQGKPDDARRFMKTLKVDLPMYVDRGRDAYAAAGLRMGSVTQLIGPTSVLKGLRSAASERVVQGRTVGNVAQLGGVFVIAPDGSVPYAHVARNAADNPPNAELLAAVSSAV